MRSAQVCRLALDVDAFDATFNLELMTALLKIGRSSEALAQYNHATDLHYNHLGIQPPEGMLAFYKKLIKIDNASKTDIDSIRAELCADDTRSGRICMRICDFQGYLPAPYAEPQPSWHNDVHRAHHHQQHGR